MYVSIIYFFTKVVIVLYNNEMYIFDKLIKKYGTNVLFCLKLTRQEIFIGFKSL